MQIFCLSDIDEDDDTQMFLASGINCNVQDRWEELPRFAQLGEQVSAACPDAQSKL